MKKPKRYIETAEYLQAARRFIQAAGRRCAIANEVELRDLLALHKDLDEAVLVAIEGIRSRGLSWAYIATATGTTRAAAWQRFGQVEKEKA